MKPDAETLRPVVPGESSRPLRVLVAAWLGKTRLIDNTILNKVKKKDGVASQ